VIKVLGTPPAIPILVMVTQQNMPLGDILRDIGYQANKRARIIVFPSRHVIELRYVQI